MTPSDPQSPRLVYRRLGARDLDPFLQLARDPHIRRYLLDGAIVDAAWCRSEIARSERSFRDTGLGLWWLAEVGAPTTPVGFAGFRVYEELGPAPQILYGLRETATGRGLATECAAALVGVARAAGLAQVDAAVDAPNRASVRVLTKLGFEATGRAPGHFGETLLFRLGLGDR